ncbi:MAG TPA: protein kinase [Terriglobales bacterium]|nr:protein kinase [Terriglobales bacterium]
MSEETNKRIGDYQILNELGSGGMGRVYRVRNVISDRIEAMKVLLPDLAGRQELATRFLREIKLMASLNHPNIAALRTAFTADNQLVMIMEYVEGTTLADRLEHGPIPAPEALNYIGQVLNALSYAHRQHVIHRDIKPANIMLTHEGVVKLMDFGIARAGDDRGLTMTGTTLGSLGYMSPEQVKGEATDARSDLYSVGVSLYEMVTGQRPFRADSDYSLMTAHVREAPKPPVELQPGLPAALNEIILMAISKDPAQRFQSADAFGNALSSVGLDTSAPQVAALKASEAATADYAVPTAVLVGAPATPPRHQVFAPVRTPTDAKTAAVPNPPSVPALPPPSPSGHRGLYMTLGALIVLAVLVAGGIYLPRNSKTEAQQGEAQQTPSPASPSNAGIPNTMQQETPPAATVPNPQTPDSTQPAPPATAPEVENSNSMQSNLAPGRSPDPHTRKLNAHRSGTEQAPSVSPESPPAQNAEVGANPGETASNSINRDEVEHQIDQLSSRAAAVNSSLDRLQQQQSIAGYGLRGDMAAKQASMKTNLSKAESAVERGDLPAAKKRADMAESDVEALEHFLGH